MIITDQSGRARKEETSSKGTNPDDGKEEEGGRGQKSSTGDLCNHLVSVAIISKDQKTMTKTLRPQGAYSINPV